jgi:hypothetical protein
MGAKRKRTLTTAVEGPGSLRGRLLVDIRQLILSAREGVARAVNSGLTMLYWHVGRRIRQDVLKEERAEYGQRIVSALGRHLEREFGRGFSETNLWRMLQFAEVFPDRKIVVSLIRELLERKLHEAVRLARTRIKTLKEGQ